MLWLWIIFIVFVLLMLALDLGVFHREDHVVRPKEALIWSGVWIALSLLFTVFVYFVYEYHWFGLDISGEEPDGRGAAVLFLTGYVLEKTLSIDNVFVISMLFSSFRVAPMYQHRVLFWGILGALAMRGIMIAVGTILIERFHWVLYFFGAFLIYTAAKMLMAKHESDPGDNFLVRLARRILPTTHEYDGHNFMKEVNGRRALTPLGLALVAVEGTDLIFAIDSIPAIFAITKDPFLVFTSNIFAMLGLRSLYFALAGIMEKFRYLKVSLALLLGLVGLKMLLKDVFHLLPGKVYWTLGTIVVIISGGVVASLIYARRHPEGEAGGPPTT